MSSDVPLASPRACLLAQTTPEIMDNGPMDPDVGGFAIGMATIFYNICVSIILIWFQDSGDRGQISITVVEDTNPEAQDSSSTLIGCGGRTRSPFPSESYSLTQINSPVSEFLSPDGIGSSKPFGHGRDYSIGDATLTLPPEIIEGYDFWNSIYGGSLRSSIYGLFLLNYSILISTATTIGRGKLSLFEAHFAIAVTASPVSVYLTARAIMDTWHLRRRMCSRSELKKNARTVVALGFGLVLPWFWLALNIVVSYHHTAFTNSYLCEDLPFKAWIEYQVLSNFIGVLDVMGRRDLWNDITSRKGLGIVSLVALWTWGVYFIHHQHDIYGEFIVQKRKYNHYWLLRWPRHLWTFWISSWTVIKQSHPWLILLIICCFHWSWIIGIYRGIRLNATYDFSYGQVFAIFSAFPPLWALIDLWVAHWNDIKKLSSSKIWAACRDEAIFFLTCKKNPWTSNINIDTRPKPVRQPRNLWEKLWIGELRPKLAIMGLLTINAGHAAFITVYALMGSQPNQRTSANNPHSNWKPFSICLYTAGFVVGCINIKASSFCYNVAEGWEKPYRHGYRFLLLPFALFISTAPLFSPFPALALSQEYQWDHGCPNRYAVLTGRSYMSQPPIISLYLRDKVHFDYALNPSGDAVILTLDLLNTTSQFEGLESSFYPLVQSISYDLLKNTTSATCIVANATTPTLCMRGYFDSHYFSFFLNDTHKDIQVNLRAMDREWSYPDDAPSFILYSVQPNGQLEDTLMQTAVTKRNHCELLKVCLSSGALNFKNLVPLGLALWAEDKFASYCTTSSLYF